MRRVVLSVAMLLLLAGGSLQARVFFRTGTGRGQVVRAQDVGWATAVEEEAWTVNGEPWTVQTLAAPLSGARTLARLRTLYEERGATVSIFTDTEMSWGQAVWEDRVTQMLVVSPRALSQSLVFLTHRSISKEGAGRGGEGGGEIPDYPGARSGSTIEQGSGGVRFLYTSSAPREVLSFYADVLMRAGWQAMLPETAGLGDELPLAVYFRGNELCAINVSSGSDGGGEQVITVLMKALKGSP